MSRYIATAAIRGANAIVKEAEEMLARAIAELGPDAPVAFPNTAYYLPVIYGFTGIQVTKLSDLIPVLQHARSLLHPVPTDQTWLPYLGETLDCGVATLLAEEAIEGIRFARGEQPERIPGLVLTGTSFTSPDMAAGGEAGGYANGPIDDIQLRAWGIQLVDGRMPGFAAIVGAAKSNEVAVEIVRQLQQRNILVFLSGNVNGRSIIHQLMEEGVELGYDTYTVPFGTDTISAIYALGFATRSALTFGGMKGGQAREILLYNKYRVFAFVLALGEVDDLKYATAAGAISYGFPTIADTVIPQILPTGITQYEHVISMPFDDIPGENDLERARKLVQKCIEVRGVKVKIAEVPIPVPYGSAFEGERVRREDMRIEFGGKYSRCFEYLRMVDLEECEDGKVTVVGPGIETVPEGGSMDMGILVEVAGRKMQLDFEPVLERQIHYFINGASGIQHIGQRDIAWIRISKAAYEKGFNLEHFGKILHARFHSDFGAIVDKVQVTIFTDKALIEEWLARAREAYNYRNQRLADLVDEAVEEFYSCTLCLPAEEEIVLPDGSFMPVERLIDTVVEDRDLSVLTLDQANLTARPVGELHINPSPQKLVTVHLSNGNALTLTANHKVLADTPHGPDWVPAGKLRPGDMLVEPGCTALVEENGPRYIVDYLPDDYRVADEAFLAQLREGLLSRYGGYAEAAQALGIPYHRLYSALYGKDNFSHQRLTLGEVKRAVAALGWDWDTVKPALRTFQGGCTLGRAELDEEVMYAAGLVAADGSVRRRGEDGRSGTQVQFTNTEPALLERFCSIVERLFGETPRRYPIEPKVSQGDGLRIEGKRRGEVCYVNNTLFGRLLAGLGIGERDREGKWRGEVISTLPRPLVAAFLRGLFDGDGHVSRHRAFFTTRTYQEARHLHLLLKKMGISSYISRTTRGYQVGTAHGPALERFREVIFSEHPRKKERLEQACPPQDDRHVVRSDVLPLVCGALLRDLVERYRPSGLRVTRLPVDYKTLQDWMAQRRRPSRVKMRRLLEALAGVVAPDDPDYRQLQAWCASELQLRRVREVVRVDSTDGRVYNFSVAETHNYVVNGVVVKNCQSFAPNHVCIISPERLGLCGAYNWLDCKASHQINPTGPNQPVPKGRCLDPVKGYFDKVNEFVYNTSHNTVQQVSMYSIIENPMTACFTRDTEVIIDGRPVAIGDFVDEHIQETFHYASALTRGPDGRVCYDRIVGMHKNPAPARLIRLLTRTGDELLLTPNHPVAVDRPEGQVWVRADQVQEGDRVYALRYLRLPERHPSTIDLLPGDLGVADSSFLERLEERLRSKFGSLAAACRAAQVKRPSPGDHAWPLGTVKALVAAAGEDWEQVKGEIRQVRIGPSTWSLPALDERLFYLLGLLASDGSLSWRGRYECFINFVNADRTLLEAFEETYNQVFPGHPLGWTEKPAGRSRIQGRGIRSVQHCFNLYGANPLLGIIAESFGVKMAGDKRWDLGRMLGLPAEWIAAFLAGCFDGDGSVRLRRQSGRWASGEAYLCIDDLRAARHLKLLLKRLGIVAYLRPSGSVYKLLLYGNSLRRFAETVPTRHPQKTGLLRKIIEHAPTLDKSVEEVLPYQVGKVLVSIPAASQCLPASTLYYYRTARSRPVGSNVRRVCETDPVAAEVLEPLLKGDTFLDPIVRAEVVENGHEHDFVYNLTLMDIHSYYANQVWVKNCGCFECIAMLIPEANGIMVVSREDPSMTPAGMTFSTLAGMAGGGLQTPGVMGVGKYYLLSKKFISADGGFKRVVWMSSILKETMAEELKQVAIREGDPDLIEKIADERVATTVEELLAYLEEKGHPALTMPPIF